MRQRPKPEHENVVGDLDGIEARNGKQLDCQTGSTVLVTRFGLPRAEHEGMMRAASILAVIMVVGTAHASVRRDHPYRKDWKHSTFGKHALIGVTARAW